MHMPEGHYPLQTLPCRVDTCCDTCPQWRKVRCTSLPPYGCMNHLTSQSQSSIPPVHLARVAVTCVSLHAVALFREMSVEQSRG